MTDLPGLAELGFSPRWQALFAPHAAAGLLPARVVRSDRGSSLVAMASGVARARLSARLRRAASERAAPRARAGAGPRHPSPRSATGWPCAPPTASTRP